MPLEKSISKKAFEHNVKREVHEGKPEKQAVAIAYSEKREAEKHGDQKAEHYHDRSTHRKEDGERVDNKHRGHRHMEFSEKKKKYDGHNNG